MSALRQPHRVAIPIGWLIGLMTLMVLSVALARWQGWREPVVDAATVWEASLLFEDLPNGDVQVRDARNGLTVAVFSGEQGFFARQLAGDGTPAPSGTGRYDRTIGAACSGRWPAVAA